MDDTFYRKIGRKYVPVSYYDSVLMDAFPIGAHVITVTNGGMCKRYRIEPALAPMIAAGHIAIDGMVKAMSNRSEQGGNISQRDIMDAGVYAMALEAEKLLTVPAIKEAYDHFMMLCKLCKESEVEVQ
jgi:hypothetical protein